MSIAKNGDTVIVHCTGKLKDGQEICNTKTSRPLQITIGKGDFLPAIEMSIVGMQIGGTKAVEIPPEDAYGLPLDALVVEVKKKDLPEGFRPHVGRQIEVKQPNGEQVNLTITAINRDTVIIDANHPLAGQKLFFDIELLEIE